MIARTHLLQVGIIIHFLLCPAESTGDVLLITPSNTVVQFINRSITFDCSHSHHLAKSFEWRINGTLIELSNLTGYQIMYSKEFSELILHHVSAKFNNTEVQCHATLLNRELVDSEVVLLLIQGTVTKVNALQVCIEEYSLFVTWSPPFSLSVSGSTQIRYIVRVQNLTSSSNSTEDTIRETNYTIISNSSQRIGCDNFNVTIFPENPVGLGEASSIALIYKFPVLQDHHLTLNQQELCDFVLSLDAPICKVTDFRLKNTNLNTTEFMLINATENNYQYHFSLNLHTQLHYQLDMLVFSGNSSKQWHFNISTAVEVCEVEYFTTTINYGNKTMHVLGYEAVKIIVIVTIVAIIAIVAIVLGVVVCWILIKKRNSTSNPQNTGIRLTRAAGQYEHQNEQEVLRNEDQEEQEAFNHVRNEDQDEKYTGIRVSQFCKYLQDEISKIEDEFKDIYNGNDKSKSIGLSPRFQGLNKISNITVYDDNRIELRPLPGHRSDQELFINASYIDGFEKTKKFIATQGPTMLTLEHFWHMIWQEKAPIIVMLTNCEQYWPDSGNIKYGQFEITLIKEEKFPNFYLRTLQIMGNNESFEVRQFQFTVWLNSSVPKDTLPLIKFHQEVQSYCMGKKIPIVVHCSAGVGPTGVFITMNSVREQTMKENMVDIIGTITRIRHQRMEMVQTTEEYLFLHDVIRKFVLFKNTSITAEDFKDALQQYKVKDSCTGMNTFESEFDDLEQVSMNKLDMKCCLEASKHPNKNYSMDNVPLDKYRVAIKDEDEDYIHAIFVNGYKKENAYIIAENPMESTAENMMKVLYQEKCTTIVMLSNQFEGDQEVCFKYWSKLRTFMMVGKFSVEVIEEREKKGYIIREMVITKDGFEHAIKQFQITCWQPDGKCSSLRSISDVLHILFEEQKDRSLIFIHCSDTITRSAMFCALAIISNRFKVKRKINVSQVVRTLRIRKPGAVPTINNYEMIFKVFQTFLETPPSLSYF